MARGTGLLGSDDHNPGIIRPATAQEQGQLLLQAIAQGQQVLGLLLECIYRATLAGLNDGGKTEAYIEKVTGVKLAPITPEVSEGEGVEDVGEGNGTAAPDS